MVLVQEHATVMTHSLLINRATGDHFSLGDPDNDVLTVGVGSGLFIGPQDYGPDDGSGVPSVRSENLATFGGLSPIVADDGHEVSTGGASEALQASGNDATSEGVVVEAGAAVELDGAYSGSVLFSGSTGTLALDHSSSFTGKILNLTGDGNPLNSDQIDLKDIAFGSGSTASFAGDLSGGVLTVSDTQDHVAYLTLVGNYTNSTFNLSSDGSGGTMVIDPPLTPFALGVDVGNPNISNPTEEAAFEANFTAFSNLMGTKPQYLDQFGDQTQPISQWVSQAGWDAASVAHSAVLQNVIPVIGLPMSSTAPGSGTADQFYQAFAAGTYDSVLQGMVKAWANNGIATQIWRPGWEMNVSSMPSYAGNDAATQADWIKAYQHIYTVLHAAGNAYGVNIQVMWNPDVMNYSASGNALQTAYPGNQYVDIIGADVYGDLYPYGDHSHLYDWDLSGQVYNSSHPVYDTSLQQWAADPINLMHYYDNPASNQWSADGSVGHATTLQQLLDLAKSTGKSFAIAETGAGNTADGAGVVDNPTFVQWLSQTLTQSGVKVSFVNIWDSNGGGNYEFSNASDGKPLEAAAWSKYFGPVSTSSAPSISSPVPTPSIVSFAPDSNTIGDQITNSSQLTLSGTAAAGITVQVFDGGVEIGAVTANASGLWSFATGVLADGSHAFTAKDVDVAGNVSVASSTLSVVVDTVAPVAPSIATFSPDSSVVGDGITSANQLTLAGTAEAGSKVLVFDGATQVGTATVDASGNWSFATGTLIDGTHYFTGQAVDAAGNVSVTSGALNVTVDTVAPNAPTIVSDALAASNKVVVAGTAEAGSTIKLYEGNTLLGTAVAASNGAWSVTTGSLAAGTHAFTANATDAAGNSSGLSAAFDPVVGTLIEASGATSLVQVGSNYLLDPTRGGSGPVLKFNGAAYVAGQFSSWTPIAAEATSSGYDVAWKNTSTGVFTVWTADSNGNFASNLLSNVSGTSTAFESIETVFQQDLNGDGVIGLRTTTIEASGATSLVQAGSNYLLDPTSSGSGPVLKYSGVAYVAGQFANWTPIAAEATSSGYDVGWKNTSTGVFTVWATDSNGNFTSNLLSNVSGTSSALGSIETVFHQDLNGDGVIGLRTTVIEASGATSLVQIGSNFLLDAISDGSGPVLKYSGVAYVAGQFANWTPIAAEATSTGYDVAWKNSATGLYTVWATDSNGNFTSNLLSNVSGTSSALGSIETVFHQDLNGDGVIGLRTTVIEASGATSLVQVGSNFLLDAISDGSGPVLKYSGVAYVAGQFANWTSIAAEATSTGYDVAWKNSATGLYTVWATDSNGNFTSNLLSNVSGTSASLKSIETVLHQDLNGDGVINSSSTVLDISGKITFALGNLSQATVIEPGATLELTGAASGSVTFKDVTGTLTLDHSTQFTGAIYGLSGNGDPSSSDILDLKDISFASGAKVAYSGDTSGGVLTVSDAQNHVAHITLAGDYTHSTFNLSSDGSGGTLVIDPPAGGFYFAPLSKPQMTAAPAVGRIGSAGDGFVFGQSGTPTSHPEIGSNNPYGYHASSGAGLDFDAIAHLAAEHAHLVALHASSVEGYLLHA
ncbi:hypothetical protein ACVMAJ_005550 [Bradyrhizobium sp. USDA 4448]